MYRVIISTVCALLLTALPAGAQLDAWEVEARSKLEKLDNV
jgi:hypothetical protein